LAVLRDLYCWVPNRRWLRRR